MAEALGSGVDTARDRSTVLVSQFRLPTIAEVVWAPWALKWVRSQWLVVVDLVSVVRDTIDTWSSDLTDIIIDASEEKLPMPKKLKQRVVRGDEAARFVIRELIRVAEDTGNRNPQLIADRILEVAGATAYDPRDPSDIPDDTPTTKQRLWDAFVSTLAAAGNLALIVSVAVAAGLWYLSLWGDTSILPTLAQDSQRVREKGRRHRVNLKPGPDK